MVEVLDKKRLTILAIGAATNIAILLLKHPDIAGQIDEIVLVAGRRSVDAHFLAGPKQSTPFRDLNFDVDPKAFEVLLNHQMPITLVPYEVCHKVWIDRAELAAMGEANKVGSFLNEESQDWIDFWEYSLGVNKFNPFDLVAAGYLIKPECFLYHQWPIAIVNGYDDTGRQAEKPYLICSDKVSSTRSVRYCTQVDDECKTYLLSRIGTHDMSAFVLGLSHINVVVNCIDEATEFYQRVLGFEQGYDLEGSAMDYKNVEMKPFALNAGLMDGKVDVDVRFLKHPQAQIYLELMEYRWPVGNKEIPQQAKTYDTGGPRHVALTVSNCKEVFDFLQHQEGVTMINPSEHYYPEKLEGFQ